MWYKQFNFLLFVFLVSGMEGGLFTPAFSLLTNLALIASLVFLDLLKN